MSYMRGDPYVFPSADSDGEIFLNIWTSAPCDDGYEPSLSRVRLPMEMFDELAVMRYAQLSEEDRHVAQQRAIEKWGGNIGCMELKQQVGRDEIKG